MKINYPRYFSLLLLKTFAISSVLSIIICHLINARHGSSFEQKQGDFIEYMVLIIWLFVLTLASFTVYLNQIERVRTSVISSTLSFFFLPLCVSALVVQAGNNDGDSLSFYLSTIVFIAVLLFFFIKYLKVDMPARTENVLAKSKQNDNPYATNE